LIGHIFKYCKTDDISESIPHVFNNLEDYFDDIGINILINIFERHESSIYFNKFKNSVEDNLSIIIKTSKLNRLFM